MQLQAKAMLWCNSEWICYNYSAVCTSTGLNFCLNFLNVPFSQSSLVTEEKIFRCDVLEVTHLFGD